MSYTEMAQLELMNAAANVTSQEYLDALRLTLSLFFAERAQKAIFLEGKYCMCVSNGRWTNIVNVAKIMGGKFGRSNIFATHSLTHSLTRSLKQQRESDGPGEGAARANSCPLDSCCGSWGIHNTF